MTTVISSTYDDKYLYFLPIVTWCWNKLGVDVICFVPNVMGKSTNTTLKLLLITETIRNNPSAKYTAYSFLSPEHKEATYAQCSRLYGACLDLPEDEIIVMGDVDLIPFKIPPYTNNSFTILGSDLVPDEQLPMCYVSAPAKLWGEDFCKNRTYQQCLDDLVGVIECEHFRGNQWCLDQSELYRSISKSNNIRNLIPRARPNTQFAANRVDRDDSFYKDRLNKDVIDAHLWRPGYTEENFPKILELLQYFYPEDDFDWLIHYNQQYKALL